MPLWRNGRRICYNDSMSTKYTKEILEEAVKNSLSISGVLRSLGLKQAGGTQSHIKQKLTSYKIDTSHFTQQAHNKGRPSSNRKTAQEILVVLPEGSLRPKAFQLRRALIESKIEYKCTNCGLTDEWMGAKLTLEVDHIDGNWLNNLIDNLRFLCPNCHSQLDTNKSWKNKVS